MSGKPTKKLLDRFTALVGRENTLGPNEDLTRYTHENRNIYIGKTPLVLKPASTLEDRPSPGNNCKVANQPGKNTNK